MVHYPIPNEVHRLWWEQLHLCDVAFNKILFRHLWSVLWVWHLSRVWGSDEDKGYLISALRSSQSAKRKSLAMFTLCQDLNILHMVSLLFNISHTLKLIWISWFSVKSNLDREKLRNVPVLTVMDALCTFQYLLQLSSSVLCNHS